MSQKVSFGQNSNNSIKDSETNDASLKDMEDRLANWQKRLEKMQTRLKTYEKVSNEVVSHLLSTIVQFESLIW